MAPPTGYGLVWSDDFNSNTIGTNWYSAGDSGYAYIADSNLYLKTDYTSGSIRRGYVKSGISGSNRKRWGPYGYWEMRAKIARKINLHNQWWFSSETWREEIDFELTQNRVSGNPKDRVDFAVCRNQGGCTGTCDCGGNTWISGQTFWDKITDDNYHILGWLWTPSKYEWYVDGIKIAQMTNVNYVCQTSTSMSIASCAPYPWSGCPVHGVDNTMEDTSGLPKYFTIDYVRFYQSGTGVCNNPVLSMTIS